jgi:hypothetical protein
MEFTNVITHSHKNSTGFELLKIKADASLHAGCSSCVTQELGCLCYQLPPGILGLEAAIALNNDIGQVLYLGLI